MKTEQTIKEGKLIRSKDGKWLGYGDNSKEWKDNTLHAIRMYLVKINGQYVTMTEGEYELHLIYSN